jgi:hypothetical protein
MAVVDPNAVVFTDRYWRMVRATLRGVFDAKTDLADLYQQQIAGAPVDEQLLVFHSEPLDVAAGLADADVTDEVVTRYRQLAQRLSWP